MLLWAPIAEKKTKKKKKLGCRNVKKFYPRNGRFHREEETRGGGERLDVPQGMASLVFSTCEKASITRRAFVSSAKVLYLLFSFCCLSPSRLFFSLGNDDVQLYHCAEPYPFFNLIIKHIDCRALCCKAIRFPRYSRFLFSHENRIICLVPLLSEKNILKNILNWKVLTVAEIRSCHQSGMSDCTRPCSTWTIYLHLRYIKLLFLYVYNVLNSSSKNINLAIIYIVAKNSSQLFLAHKVQKEAN